MSMHIVYCIDTSSLLEAWTRQYPRVVFPSLWEKIEALIATGRLCSPEEIRIELERKEDELGKWAKAQSGLFVPLSHDQTTEVSQILTDFQLLVDTSRGRSGGDPWVIALAKLHGYTVVTEEKLSNSPKKPKIPDVCNHYGIAYITVLELIRHEKWTF